MATGYSMEIDGMDRVNAALMRVKPHLRKATVPVMQSLADEIAAGARARLMPDHPRNLFRVKGRGQLSPKSAGNYKSRKKGAYLFEVAGSSGAAGKPQVLAEFAKSAVTPQGRALVSALDSYYGGTGRILWHEADRLSSGAVGRIEAAVAQAAAAIENDMGSA